MDCLLTSPERFDKDFLIVSASRPYGLMGKFISFLPAGLEIDSPMEMYEEAYQKTGYRMNLHWVIKNFWANESAVEYYHASVNVPEGVIIIPKGEEEIVNKVVELLKANIFTQKYFVNTSEHVELMHQVAIYFTYKNVPCKALLDGIRIDHEKKEIEPFDLKTSYSVVEFPNMYFRLGYFRQAAFYEQALTSEDSPIKHLLDQGYTLLDFVFVVAEKKLASTQPAVIYKTDPSDRKIGLLGAKKDELFIKGIDQLLEDYVWHVEHNYWDMSRELYFNQGIIPIKVFDNNV